ncbi:MAG: exodeoxyribonuclease VII large subunit, partial [Hyphomicrobiales bacterium]|nr:exodeoxyribonuclease VII large subunit [Hyphomicrobiales bacterium]
ALAARTRGALDQRLLRMAELARGLARHSPRAHLAGLRERARSLERRLERIAPALIERPRRAAEAAARAMGRERRLFAARARERAETLARLEARLARACADRLAARRASLAAFAQLLDAFSYRGTLARGFALVRDQAGAPLRRVAEVRPAQALRIEFADGEATALAKGRSALREPPSLEGLPPRPRRGRRDRDAEGQGTLF